MKVDRILWVVLFIFLFLSIAGLTAGAKVEGLTGAGTGSWHPEITEYPRLLYHAGHKQEIRDRLASEPYLTLWRNIFYTAGQDNETDRTCKAQVAKASAFVYVMDRGPNGNDPLPERQSYLNRAKYYLNHMDTGVSSDIQQWQYRSHELIMYCQAYDMLLGEGVPWDQAGGRKIQEFARNLSWNSYINPAFSLIRNNHRLMVAAALGMAAVTSNGSWSSYDTHKRPRTWIDFAMTNIDNVLWGRGYVDADGGYAEGPWYLIYSMEHLIPFFKAMRNFGEIGHLADPGSPDGDWTESYKGYATRNQWYDPRYQKIYDWITKIRMPDGRVPALDDTYINASFPQLAIMADLHAYYSWPLVSWDPNRTDYDMLDDCLISGGIDLRIDYICAGNLPRNVPPEWPATWFLPESGNAVFRSGWEAKATYFHLFGEHGTALEKTGAHNHADETSFILHAGRELLAMDPGYISYTNNDPVRYAHSHNLILVDGEGPLAATKELDMANGANAYIQNYFDTTYLDHAEVQTVYGKHGFLVNKDRLFTRNVLFVDNTFFVIADDIRRDPTDQSPRAVTYTWMLHGNGLLVDGTYEHKPSDHEAIWTHNTMRLKAHVTAIGGVDDFGYGTWIHEIGYNQTANHTALEVKKNGLETGYLSILWPASIAEDFPQMQTQSNDLTASIKITGHSDLYLVAKTEQQELSLPGSMTGLPDIGTDGEFILVKTDVSGYLLRHIFFKKGRTFTFGGTPMITSPSECYASIRYSDRSLEGYVLGSNQLDLYTGTEPSTFSSNIVSHRFERGMTSITLASSNESFSISGFQIEATELENPGFEEGLDSWKSYGDGVVEATSQDAFNGSLSAHIRRDGPTGNYFGLYQEDIVAEPDTEYRLSLWVKTKATSGYAAAALGVWSGEPSLNHHTDFGYVSGMSEWVHISGIWKSRPDGNVIRVMLFGSPDFIGEAYFDSLVLEEVKPQNTGFESGLRHWERYGDGTMYEAVEGGVEGSYCAHLRRDGATGNYFGLVQRKIPCEPNTTYRLALWVKTDVSSGSVAAALGNWGSPNTHQDFGWTGGHVNWTQISGTWTSRWDETSMDIVLYGSTDFSGDAYFDNVVLEKVGVAPLEVTILGPSILEYKKLGTYTANVSRGLGSSSYQWYLKMDGSNNWYPLGKQRTQTQCSTQALP
jgi:hypothetical protein